MKLVRNSGYAIYIYIRNFVNITNDFMEKDFGLSVHYSVDLLSSKHRTLEEIEFVYLVYYFKKKWR